jgi:hypothetical protein
MPSTSRVRCCTARAHPRTRELVESWSILPSKGPQFADQYGCRHTLTAWTWTTFHAPCGSGDVLPRGMMVEALKCAVTTLVVANPDRSSTFVRKILPSPILPLRLSDDGLPSRRLRPEARFQVVGNEVDVYSRAVRARCVLSGGRRGPGLQRAVMHLKRQFHAGHL